MYAPMMYQRPGPVHMVASSYQNGLLIWCSASSFSLPTFRFYHVRITRHVGATFSPSQQQTHTFFNSLYFFFGDF
jgi:hypothetical protein